MTDRIGAQREGSLDSAITREVAPLPRCIVVPHGERVSSIGIAVAFDPVRAYRVGDH
jgi:hypothetical protein